MTLSKRAEKLLERLKSGDFYPCHASDTPKAMQELIDAGLVARAGRVEIIRACYVPAKGYTPYREEVFEK